MAKEILEDSAETLKNIPWHNLDLEQVSRLLHSDPKKGLSEQEAKRRQRIFGKNRLPKRKSGSKFKLFLEQFKSPLVYILVIVGIVVLILEKYPNNLIESGFVFIVILINSLFGFLEENKTSNVLEKLKKILKQKAVVEREGAKREILREEIVPGDIIVLRPGDKVPADGRLVEAENLRVAEAFLTGEWLPAQKKVETLEKETSLLDRDNMVYSGSLIESGKGKAIVVAIGKNTEIGKISTLVSETKEERTPLQKKLSHFSRLIGTVIVSICFGIFLLGIIQGRNPKGMFETAAAISVGGIPEALPIVITLVLSIGMERLLKRKGLVRRLSSVETLGSTSVICCDKTKTLTQGKMKLLKVVSGNENLALRIAVLCNEAFVENPAEKLEKWKVRGSPTDAALVKAAAKKGILKPELEKESVEISAAPFDSVHKYELSLRREKGKNILYISGAPERILERSKNKKGWEKKLKELTENGMRVIGVGYKTIFNYQFSIFNNKLNFNLDSLARDFTFVGLLALSDPVRPGVKEAIGLCKDSGLKPIVVTGDSRLTAISIARQIGLEVREGDVIEGRELDKISDKELERISPKIKIYARTDPKDKLRIVKAWQKRGEVVAMTGDGVNDAPALRKADIGIGLGSGTEVAKEASDLILLTDGFNIIVRAIEQGRIILDNIRKSISYVLADSFTSVILVGFSVILGWPLPILWVQILWNNIIEDTLPVISYAFEPAEKGVMKRKPESPKSPLLTKEMRVLIFGTGLIDEFLSLILFWVLWKLIGLDLSYVRTMVFGAICLDTAFVIFCYKNLRKNIWRINFFNNKFLLISSALVFVIFALSIYLPPFQVLLHTVPLGIGSWLTLLGIGIVSMFLIESTKWYFISRHETEE